jgi:cytochrome c oxidase assembly protein subunit 15
MMVNISRLARISLVLIFLVILAGAVVRTTGSGMGCPDWPKCFGHLIPPTNAEQVMFHENETYKKGQFIVYKDALWVANENFTSAKKFSKKDWTRYEKHEYATFNATHTWIEYINRLLGALSGLPVLAMFIASLFVLRKQPIIALLAAATLFALGYEAWLGKLVVDGNLVPDSITKHMMGSLVIVVLLLSIITMDERVKMKQVSGAFRGLLIVALLLLAVQIILGTQVREQVDVAAGITPDRSQWIEMLDAKVLIHRSGSILIFGLLAWMFWRNWRNDYALHSLTVAFWLIFLEVIVGTVMYYFNVPKFLQPIHLMLSTGAFALLVWGVLRTEAVVVKKSKPQGD